MCVYINWTTPLTHALLPRHWWNSDHWTSWCMTNSENTFMIAINVQNQTERCYQANCASWVFGSRLRLRKGNWFQKNLLHHQHHIYHRCKPKTIQWNTVLGWMISQRGASWYCIYIIYIYRYKNLCIKAEFYYQKVTITTNSNTTKSLFRSSKTTYATDAKDYCDAFSQSHKKGLFVDGKTHYLHSQISVEE